MSSYSRNLAFDTNMLKKKKRCMLAILSLALSPYRFGYGEEGVTHSAYRKCTNFGGQVRSNRKHHLEVESERNEQHGSW